MTDLSKRLKEISERLLPSDIIEQYHHYESVSHDDFTGADYGGFIDIFNISFTLLVKQVNRVSFVAKADWVDHRSVQYILLSHNIKTFYSVVDRVSYGFADDAIVLMRPLLETIIRLVHISCYPEDPYSVLVHKPPKGTRHFQFNNFVENDLKLDWLQEYGIVSSFTHSNSYRTIEYAAAYGGQGIAPREIVTQTSGRDYTEVVTNSITFYLYCYMQIVRRVFTVELEDSTDEEVWRDATEMEDILKTILLEHPNPSGRLLKLVKDADDLVNLILQADLGESPWEDIWAKMRRK